MAEAVEKSEQREADLRARIDRLEQIVHDLTSGRDPAPDQNSRPSTPLPSLPGFSTSDRPVQALGAKPVGFTRGRAKFIRDLLRQRRQRELYFPADLFADPAWDMMLDLYAAHYEGRDISVSSLCIAAAVPATTALRWMKLLVDEGRFIRFSDPEDGRRIFVGLSDETRSQLDAYFDNLEN